MSFADDIARDMAALPEATRKAVRPRLREAGEGVATDARSNAAWSSRIPGTVKVSVSFRDGREGVSVKAGGPTAPHARPFEDVKGRGFFRHPVLADGERNTWTWVSQVSRPFLFPAGQANEGNTETVMRAALDDAAQELGFGGS